MRYQYFQHFATWVTPYNYYTSTLTPGQASEESLERLHRPFSPSHLETFGLAGVTALYGSLDGPAHPGPHPPRGPRLPVGPASPAFPSSAFHSPLRSQEVPSLLRPAGRGRAGRQRCQRGNGGGAREAEVVPGIAGPLSGSTGRISHGRAPGEGPYRGWMRSGGPRPPPAGRLFPGRELPLWPGRGPGANGPAWGGLAARASGPSLEAGAWSRHGAGGLWGPCGPGEAGPGSTRGPERPGAQSGAAGPTLGPARARLTLSDDRANNLRPQKRLEWSPSCFGANWKPVGCLWVPS